MGETYWHREHQIVHVEICPKHRCFLENSTIPIGSKVTPGLYSAETEVPYDIVPKPCMNDELVKFIHYVLEVFRAPVDMETDVPIGSFLRSVLDDKYLSESRAKVYSTKLYEDYCEFFQNIQEPMGFEGFRKIYNNYSLDHYRIYQLAYFQRIPVEKLANRPITIVNTAMEEYYHELSMEYGIEYETVRNMRLFFLERTNSHVASHTSEKERSMFLKEDFSCSMFFTRIERRFGIDKRCYSLGCITAKLQHTSEVMIYLSVLTLNLQKRLRLLLRLFFNFYWQRRNLRLVQ